MDFGNPKFLYKIITGLKVFTRFLKMKKIENSSFSNKKRQHYGILAIATSPDFRGRGIGATFNDFSEKIAKKNHLR